MNTCEIEKISMDTSFFILRKLCLERLPTNFISSFDMRFFARNCSELTHHHACYPVMAD